MNPNSSSWGRLCYIWNIPFFVLLSLIIQLLLSYFGNKRKYKRSPWMLFVVWISYLGADGVAALALGKLSDAALYSPTRTHPHSHYGTPLVMWAPLLLVHLGGPDAITAYAHQDNELWLRFLLSLVSQGILALNVLYLSNSFSFFSVLAFLLLVAGVIKYSERIMALNLARGKQLNRNIPLASVTQVIQTRWSLNEQAQPQQYKQPLYRAHLFCRAYKPHFPNYVPPENEIHSELKKILEIPDHPTESDKLLQWATMEVVMGSCTICSTPKCP